MKKILTPFIVFISLVLSGCAAQEASDRYNASLAVGKAYQDVKEETRLNQSATKLSLKTFTSAPQFTMPMYGQAIAEEHVNRGIIYKHVDVMESSSGEFLGGIISNDKMRYVIYYFLVDEKDLVLDWATATYEASSIWSLNPLAMTAIVTDIELSKKNAEDPEVAKLDDIVTVSSGNGIGEWR
ncbi:hypothetical protein EA004_07645 [Vibrio anguillarum]|uniref:Lipoprotein n=2 Tax=Vibrio anguillarum TaxID=55601 RepID=A0ABR9Z4M9_VIBAN|nr:hypothetical protein [Vibrio anguillarum]MBF4244914.1 hypothetical protein [Vibrio anguillarum]MBF4372967.1 hypothetical protein [Vibrio anguillarum]